jgi:hypothetical protein
VGYLRVFEKRFSLSSNFTIGFNQMDMRASQRQSTYGIIRNFDRETQDSSIISVFDSGSRGFGFLDFFIDNIFGSILLKGDDIVRC